MLWNWFVDCVASNLAAGFLSLAAGRSFGTGSLELGVGGLGGLGVKVWGFHAWGEVCRDYT